MGVLFYNSLFSFIATASLFGWQIYQASYLTSESPRTELGLVQGLPPPEVPALYQVWAYEGWQDWKFCVLFLFAGVMGSVLNYSIFLCTTTNSALTTSVIGCLKNVFAIYFTSRQLISSFHDTKLLLQVLTTYLGMIFMPGYTFTWLNFAGLNVSILGSLYYTYVTMFKGLPGFGG